MLKVGIGNNFTIINPSGIKVKQPNVNQVNAIADCIKLKIVNGTLFLFVLFVIKNLNKAGCKVLETINTENIPIIVIIPIDFREGC